MSLTAVYTDFLDSKTQTPQIIELAQEYPIESGEAYLTAAPFFRKATQVKWELNVCLTKAAEEIETAILHRAVDMDETITIVFDLKTEMVKEIIIYKNKESDNKYSASDLIQIYMKTLFDSFFASVPKEHVEELEFVVC